MGKVGKCDLYFDLCDGRSRNATRCTSDRAKEEMRPGRSKALLKAKIVEGGDRAVNETPGIDLDRIKREIDMAAFCV